MGVLDDLNKAFGINESRCKGCQRNVETIGDMCSDCTKNQLTQAGDAEQALSNAGVGTGPATIAVDQNLNLGPLLNPVCDLKSIKCMNACHKDPNKSGSICSSCGKFVD